jgi:ATP-dependent DNA ligase
MAIASSSARWRHRAALTRNAVDFTDRMAAIASAAARLKADSFTIDGEAVVIGPDGLSQFDQLRRNAGSRSAMLYTVRPDQLDGKDLRSLSLLGRPTRGEMGDIINPGRAHSSINVITRIRTQTCMGCHHYSRQSARRSSSRFRRRRR